MSSTKHDILVTVTQTGITQVDSAMKQFANTSGLATKSQDALGGAMGKTQGSAVKLTGDINKGEKATKTADSTVNKFAGSQDKAGKSTQSFAEKFRGNRGLIFSVTGIITAGIEAIGMFQNFQNALAKQAAAQDTINRLEAEGITKGREYTQAQKDLDDANRSVTFALRIMALSMGDLIPYTLLIVNQFVNMRTAATEAAAAKNALTTSVNSLGSAASTAASGGLTQVFNAAGQLTQGVTSMDTTVRNATVATNEMYTSSGQLLTGLNNMGVSVRDNTTWIGTRNSGLVGGVGALNNTMTQSTSLTAKFGEAFRKIGDWIRALPGHFTSVGASIKGFFTNFGTNMGKIPGLFKAAGTAVLVFGRALLSAFLSNPVTGIIVAIGVAVSALIFDFGGFRTAVNKAGEALGNAIPALKGALTWIGEVGNAALDSVAGFFGFETATMRAREAASALAVELAPLVAGLESVIETGQKLELLGSNVAILETIRSQIAKLGQQIGQEGSYITGTIAMISSNLNNLSMRLKDTAPPEVKAALQEVVAALDAIKNTAQPTEAQVARLDTTFKNFDATAGGAVTTIEQAGKATQTAGAAVSPYADEIRQLDAALKENEKAEQKASAELSDKTKVVFDYIKATGIQIKENTKLKETLFDNAISVAQYGDKLVIVNDEIVDHAASQKKLADAQNAMWEDAIKMWAAMEEKLTTIGHEKLPLVIDLIEATKQVYPELGAAVEGFYKNYINNMDLASKGLSDLIDKALEQADATEDAEQKAIEAERKRIESIKAKAQELGIFDKIQNLSIETMDFANKIEEESQKAMDKSRQTLMALAYERGLDIELLDQGTEKNLEYIASHNLAGITLDEVRAKTGQLIAARQEDQRATALDTLAAEELAKALNINIPLQDASAKGIMAMVQAHDDIHDAATIATDDVLEWSAQLERNRVVEEATIEKLLEMADAIGVEIPDAIRKEGSTAIKEYIEDWDTLRTEGIKALDDIQDRLNKGLDFFSSAFDKIGKDAAAAFMEGKKEFRNFLKETGLDPDNPLILQGLVDMAVNTVDAEDEFNSFVETVAQNVDTLSDTTSASVQMMVDNWVESIADKFGDDSIMTDAVRAKGDELIAVFNNIMAKGDMSGPEAFATAVGQVLSPDAGKQIAQYFGIPIPQTVADEIMNGQKTVEGAAETGLVTPINTAAGGLMTSLPGAIRPGIEAGVAEILGAKPQYLSASGEITDTINTGLEQGADKVPGAMELLVNKYLGTAQSREPDAASTGTELAGAVGEGANQGADQYAADPMYNFVQKYLAPARTSTEPTEVGTEMGLSTTGGVTAGIQQGEPQTAEQMKATILVVLGEISNAITNYSDNAIPLLMTYMGDKFALFEPEGQKLVLQFNTMFTNISTALTNFVDTTLATFVSNVGTKLTEVGKAFDTLNSSTASALDNMKSNITAFASNAVVDLTRTGQAATDMQQDVDIASNNTVSSVDKMNTKISSFASSAVSNFGKVGSAAKTAAGEVKQLQSAIDSLKDKTVTITVKYNVQGKPSGLQHGGTFIADEPTRIAGVNVAETFPEIVNVIPLDPREQASPFNDISVNVPSPGAPVIPSLDGLTAGGSTGGAGGGGGTTVTGNLYATIQLPNGEALASVIKPFMLRGYSSITT